MLQENLPTLHDSEKKAIFVHNLFAQTYSTFNEPYRTKAILLWLDFEAQVISRSKVNQCFKTKGGLSCDTFFMKIVFRGQRCLNIIQF